MVVCVSFAVMMEVYNGPDNAGLGTLPNIANLNYVMNAFRKTIWRLLKVSPPNYAATGSTQPVSPPTQ